jgi:hypothetical protein
MKVTEELTCCIYNMMFFFGPAGNAAKMQEMANALVSGGKVFNRSFTLGRYLVANYGRRHSKVCPRKMPRKCA